METSIFLIFTLILGGGTGNDLLDLVPTEVYWKAKDVEPTVGNLMLELNSIKPDDTSKPTAARKLMAIRALGELKSPDAMNNLKTQLESKEMFVADYAQRAIDSIEGKPARTSGVPPDRMKQDLYMLPAGCGAVGQVQLRSGKALTLPKAKEGEDGAAGGDPRSMLEQTANQMIYIAEMIGNVRVNGVTIGVSEQVGPQAGFVTLYVRGQWDADAMKGAIQPQLPVAKTGGGTEYMCPSYGGMAVAVPSDELFVLTGGPPNVNMPLDDIGEAIKTNKGKFDEATDLAKLVESVDTKQPAWAALWVSENYRQAPPLAPFDSL